MNLLLVRHGEIPSNIKKVYAGNSPERLTARGENQASVIAGELKNHNIYALYASPVERAMQTAQIIGQIIGKDVVIENAFREIEMGPWAGMSEMDIAQQDPEAWAIWNKNPAELNLSGRETLDDLLQRVLTGVRKISREMAGESVVIVTHVAIIRVLMLWCSRESLNLYKTILVPNAKIFEINIDRCPSL